MRHERYSRASLMIAICALVALTTPLVNLLVHAAQDESVLSMGTGLFLFWMTLIILTGLTNRFHKEADSSTPPVKNASGAHGHNGEPS